MCSQRLLWPDAPGGAQMATGRAPHLAGRGGQRVVWARVRSSLKAPDPTNTIQWSLAISLRDARTPTKGISSRHGCLAELSLYVAEQQTLTSSSTMWSDAGERSVIRSSCWFQHARRVLLGKARFHEPTS